MYPDIKLMSYHHANKFTVRQLRPNKRKKNTITLHCNTDSIHLFHSSRYNPHHVLHRLLPPPKDTGHMLRQRAHNLTLLSDVSLTAMQNFIPRMFSLICTEQYYEWMNLTLLKFISHMSRCMFFSVFVFFMYLLSRVTQVRLSFVHWRITYLLSLILLGIKGHY